jgi:hypothetical protein
MPGGIDRGRAPSTLQAGVARRQINPPLGIKTVGFSSREGVAEAIESDLTVSCLVLACRDGERVRSKVAVIALDLCNPPLGRVERWRRLVADAIGTPPSHVMVNLNHTHSAPALPGHPPEFEYQRPMLEAYQAMVVDRLLDAARDADASLQDARIVAGWGESHIGINRREMGPDGMVFLGEAPDGVVDPAVGVIRVDGPDGRPIAILFSYGCHTVVVGPRSPVISPDFPGAARDTIEKVLGGTAVFLQACGGDIMPIGGMGYETDCRDAKDRIGMMLGGEVIRVAAGLRSHIKRGERTWLRSLLGKGMTLTPWVPVEGPTCSYLRAVDETLALDLVELPPLAEAEAIREERYKELDEARAAGEERTIQVTTRFAAWTDRLVEAVRSGRPNTWDFGVQALRINDIVLVGLSAETFAATGITIKARSPFEHTHVLGYTNGCVCYLPRAEDYPAGGWKVRARYQIPDLVFQSYQVPTALDPGSERRVVEHALEMVRRMA